MNRSLLVVMAFAARAWMPQTACDGTRVAGADLPIVETFTTADGLTLGVQVVASNVAFPWSMVFTPDGRMLFTERAGRVRVIKDGRLLEAPALQLTDVNAVSEGGLLGIALHPDFLQNHYVYLFYTTGVPGAGSNRLVRYRESNNVLGERAVLLESPYASTIHHGGRIRFGPDRKLYITIGDGFSPQLPQSLEYLNGKVLRINDDGTTPSDNPFGSPIWTWGHRNPQGIDWHPITGELWSTEHGETDKDELNVLRPGRNYGWPVIQGVETRPGMETPFRSYTPGLAPSGMSFYHSPRMRALRNDQLFATLRGQHIHRVQFDPLNPARILGEERWLERKFGRIRDVVMGPDGAIYFCTSNLDGAIPSMPADDRIARIVPVR